MFPDTDQTLRDEATKKLEKDAEETLKNLEPYLGIDAANQLRAIVASINRYDFDHDTEELFNFLEGHLRKTVLVDVDEKTLAMIKQELRGYFNDLGIYNLPRFWTDVRRFS